MPEEEASVETSPAPPPSGEAAPPTEEGLLPAGEQAAQALQAERSEEKPPEGGEPAPEGSPETLAESAFDRWVAEVRALPPEDQGAALEQFESTLPEEQRAALRWNRKEGEAETTQLKARESEQGRTRELDRRKATANQVLTTHLRAIRAKLLNPETEDPNQVNFNSRGIQAVMQEFGNAEGERLFDGWRREVANAVVDAIEELGEPLSRDESLGILEAAGGERATKGAVVKAHVMEAVKRGSDRAVAEAKVAWEEEHAGKVQAEAAAMVAEKLRGVPVAPTPATSGAAETRSDDELLLDGSTPPDKITDILARRKAAR